MAYIDGLVSRKVIKRWLEDYHEIGKKGADLSSGGGSATFSDGWTGGKINKLMLKQALENIPDKVVKYCAYARWIHLFSRRKTLKALKAAGVEISVSTYQSYCGKAINFIYQEINGERVGVKELVELILEE